MDAALGDGAAGSRRAERSKEMTVTEDRRREIAVKRLKEKSDFRVHLLIYLTVNAMLIAFWAVTGGVALTAAGAHMSSFFWPIFPLLGWGVGLVAHGYTAYVGDTYTEEQIQREMRKLPQ
jgi:hypothetical protein